MSEVWLTYKYSLFSGSVWLLQFLQAESGLGQLRVNFSINFSSTRSNGAGWSRHQVIIANFSKEDLQQQKSVRNGDVASQDIYDAELSSLLPQELLKSLISNNCLRDIKQA